MPGINKYNVAQLLLQAYNKRDNVPSPFTQEEIELRDRLKDLLDSEILRVETTEEYYEEGPVPYECNVEDLETIYEDELDKELLPEQAYNEMTETASQSSVSSETSHTSNSTYLPSSPEFKRQFIPYLYKRRAVEYWRSGVKKPLNWETVKKKFWKLKTRSMLYRWVEQVDEVGTRLDKLKFVYEATYEDFQAARRRLHCFHDSDFKRCALIHAEHADLENFTASKYFLWKFKNYYRLPSRKITTFVTQSKPQNTEKLMEEINDFREEINDVIEEKGPANVANTDQTGCNLEIRSGRTHDYKGVKKVEVLAQSISATTHSYTMQMTTTADGRVLPKTLMVLQERNGVLSERVKESLPKQCKNIVVTASKSGKCTKEHVKIYHREVYSQCMPSGSVLVEDSWAGHIDTSVVDGSVPDNYKCTLWPTTTFRDVPSTFEFS
ncbi:hypothetical protein B566_EDAN001484 [Ephemera danica]|nr:hypothetical protein B566_EDAN001484 [Ephemera danica]